MIQVEYEALGFKKSVSNGRHIITCKWADVIHAVVTVGRKD
jgi:hypothetical protein